MQDQAKRDHQRRSHRLLASLLVCGLASPTLADSKVDEQALAHAQKMLEVRQTDAPWTLPQPVTPAVSRVSIDTETSTRRLANERLIQRLGIAPNRVVGADRVHITFDDGSAELTEASQALLAKLTRHVGSQRQVVITGYAGPEVDADTGLALAKERAMAIANAMREYRIGMSIMVDATSRWPGDPTQARRGEIFVMKGIE